MIHSMAGGNLGKVSYNDFAKVKIEGEQDAGFIAWYISLPNVKEGDRVLVPFGKTNKRVEAVVLRVDKCVSSQCSPIPLKLAKEIIKKL